MNTKKVPTVHRCQCPICQEGEDQVVEQYHAAINLLLSRLNEIQRRWYVGTLSRRPEGPSIRTLVAVTGMSSATILRGRRELAAGLSELPVDRQRRAGGGRWRAEKRILVSKP